MTQFWTNLRYKVVCNCFGQRYFLSTSLNKDVCTINLIFIGPCIVMFSYSTTNKMHLLSQIIYSCKTLYMFRSFRPSSGAQNCVSGWDLIRESSRYQQLFDRYHCCIRSVLCKIRWQFFTFGILNSMGYINPGRGVDHPTPFSVDVKERAELYL